MINVSGESKVMCPQFVDTELGQEDCLLLNVYIPDFVFDDPSLKVPVMVFIHGGGLVSYCIYSGTQNKRDDCCL